MRVLFPSVAALLGTQLAQGQDLKNGVKGILDPQQYEKFNRERIAQPTAPATPPTQINAYLFSPYLFINWSLGVIRPYTAEPQRAWLKYNAVTHELVARTFVNEAEIVNVVDADLLREFTIGDSSLGLRLTFRRYLNARVLRPSLRTAFFEVHYDVGKTALLCQRTHTPAMPSPGPGGFTGAQYVLTYFFKTTNNEILPVALQPEEVLAALGPAHVAALAAYARQQQLNLEQEADVVRLLAYHDAL